MMVYYQTLLGATAADPENSKTAFEILLSSKRSDLDDWIGAAPEPQGQISQNSNLRIQMVDPNLGTID
jgi:hypothetical protein